MAIETCPTCGNGMAVVRAGVGWCRRCGTVRYIAHPDTKETLVAVPRLVDAPQVQGVSWDDLFPTEE